MQLFLLLLRLLLFLRLQLLLLPLLRQLLFLLLLLQQLLFLLLLLRLLLFPRLPLLQQLLFLLLLLLLLRHFRQLHFQQLHFQLAEGHAHDFRQAKLHHKAGDRVAPDVARAAAVEQVVQDNGQHRGAQPAGGPDANRDTCPRGGREGVRHLPCADDPGVYHCSNSSNQSSGKDSDSVKHPVDSIDVNGDSVWLYRGIVVDGSRSNINLKFYDDTLDFEIPSDMDFTYEVGDSVSILVKADSNGSDSIAEIQNYNQQEN